MSRFIGIAASLLLVSCTTVREAKPFVEAHGDLSGRQFTALAVAIDELQGIDRERFIANFTLALRVQFPNYQISAPVVVETSDPFQANMRIFISDRPPGTHQPPGPPPIQDEWTCVATIVPATGGGKRLDVVALIPKSFELESTLAGIIGESMRSEKGPPN